MAVITTPHCPACQRDLPEGFAPGPGGRPGARCPRCQALERHRFLATILDRLGDHLATSRHLLDCAPHQMVRNLLHAATDGAYVGIDLFEPERRIDALADLTRLPFADRAFQTIVCYHVLEHIPDDATAMAELRRVLADDGIAVIQVPRRPGAETDEDPEAPEEERIRRFGQADHVRYYGRDFEDRLRAAGFVVEAVRPRDVLYRAEIERFGITDQEVWIAAGSEAVHRGALGSLREDERRASLSSDPRPEHPPFWVLGAPRSGTTYLVEVLGRHPDIVLTNETRIMTLVNRAVHDLAEDEWVLMEYRADVQRQLRRAAREMVETFYGRLGATGPRRWGDKFPHYADPDTDPDALATIDELFPESRYINVVRHGGEVVASLVGKGWADVDEAIDVWRRHVTHAERFRETVSPERWLDVRYEDLVADATPTVAKMLAFLGLDLHDDVARFIAEQEEERTPFSGPTTPAEHIGASDWRSRLRGDAARVEEELASLLETFGYA